MGFPDALVRSTLASVDGDENMALEKLCSGQHETIVAPNGKWYTKLQKQIINNTFFNQYSGVFLDILLSFVVYSSHAGEYQCC